MRYAGLAALSAAAILLELTLTRIYSVTHGYHFAFLAVSLGLMGFGASGTALFVAPGLWRRAGNRLLSLSALLFTLASIGSYWAINSIPFDAYRLALEPVMLLYLAVFYVVQVVPFFFAGLALGGALSLEPARAGELYGASLVGSGLGSLLALGGPAASGPSGALGMAGVLGSVAWAAFTAGPSRGRLLLSAGIGIPLVAGAWLLPRTVDLDMSPYKALPQVLRQRGAGLAWTGWNAFSRVDVVESGGLHQAPGLSFVYADPLPPQTGLTTDGDSLTSITRVTPEQATFTGYLPGAVAYGLRQGARTLVVEPGGGLEVLTALHHGAAHVVGLVGNPLEAHILKDRFHDAAGGLFSDPQVEVVTGNPRGYLARRSDQFDVIAVGLRDAFRPITSGAYSLQENHLYTVEAFSEYLRHLSPHGVLVATRWAQTPPSEELRLAATLIEALEGVVAGAPGERLAVVRTLQTVTFLATREPMSPWEIEAVRLFAESRRMDVSYLPSPGFQATNRYFVLPQEVYFSAMQRLLDPRERRRFYAEQHSDIAPTTDDRPFYFHFFRWGQTREVLRRLGKEWQPFGGAGFLVLPALLVISVALSAALILAPLLAARRTAMDRPAGRESVSGWRGLAYFFALGLAFLWIELPLMQRFILLLAQPIYSFGIVLFAILVASGAGSILSARLGRRRGWAIPLLAALALGYALGSGPLVDLMLELPTPARLPVSALAIAPLATAMGMPFPIGVAVLAARRPALIPWAWGVNGCASVVGSVLAALMALSWGFSWVMAAAALSYLAAWAVLYPALRAGPAQEGARTAPAPG